MAAVNSLVTLGIGPASEIKYLVTGGFDTGAMAAATAYTLTGPAGGTVGALSGTFTVTPNGLVSGDVVVTPDDALDGGSFTPSSVTFADGTSTAKTFRYTAASAGTKTLSTTNDSTLTDPSSLSFVASDASGSVAARRLSVSIGIGV